MAKRTPALSLLDAVARDLSASLEAGALPRPDRGPARRLLMEAWLLLEAPPEAADPVAVAALARRMDALAARGAAGSAPPPPPPDPDRLGIAARLDRLPPVPLQDRLEALESRVDALARRTRHMVEHAEAAAARTGRLGAPPAPPREAGREELELVWGDDEPR